MLKNKARLKIEHLQNLLSSEADNKNSEKY